MSEVLRSILPSARGLRRFRPLWWISLALLVLPFACTSQLVHDLTEVTQAVDVRVVDQASDRLLLSRPHMELPAQLDTEVDTGLRRVRFSIPIDRYLTVPEVPAPGEHIPPGKALLVSQALDGMDIYLNGVWIAGLPRSSETARYKWHRPLVAPLARRLLRHDKPNLLTFELSSHDPRTLLPPLYIGGIGSTNLVFELSNFIGSSLANASNLLCLLAGLFLMGAGIVNREEGKVFARAGALTTVWALLFWLVLLPYVPAGLLKLWTWAQYVCLGAVVGLLTLFVFAFIGERMPRHGRYALAVAVLTAPVLYPFAGPGLRAWLAQYWMPLLMLFYLYATVRLARHAVRTRSRPAFSLLALTILTQVFALHDHNVVAQLLPVHVPGPGWTLAHLLAAPMLLSHLTMPLLLLVTGQRLLARIRSQVERIRQANQVLTDTLLHRERELLVSYQRQRDMESEAAAQSERDRIYRELHDGIGSRLVTTLFSVRDRDINHGQLEISLLDALKDIREIISATTPVEERTIQDVLFGYATSLDEALSSDSFSVEIDMPEGREVVLLGDLSRSVRRIAEETVANTVKYAEASRIRIGLRLDDLDVLCLDIEDNGRGGRGGGDGREGLPASTAPGASSALSGGRGLGGMRERAHQMGGVFEFTLTPAGARTQLRLPLGPVHEIREGAHRSQSDAALCAQS
ncbi:Signal transduction histidine kinase [Roseateles sp. YR242]|uniref:sensor histidine kinase n=1 Tax=Roseateles sp. YR242 TaxID=1855305 RepID=UPI0008B3FC21|nr:ATP-binding protein [Roseateles sp. YR242]SEK21429.1 Signal transduction histidine kinase [Roseateles sp. YR242]